MDYNGEYEPATVAGFICKTCKRFHTEEHMAAYCHSTKSKCRECGGECDRHWTKCESCMEKDKTAKFEALPEVEWDGKTPLVDIDRDRFYYDSEDLFCIIDELQEVDPAKWGLRLLLAEPMSKPHFDFNSMTEDYGTEDGAAEFNADTAPLEKQVNDFIEANLPQLWEEGRQRVRLPDALVAEFVEDIKKRCIQDAE